MAGNTQKFTLQFDADTTRAKKSIENLAQSLKRVQTINTQQMGLDAQIYKAAQAAKELEMHLGAALNKNTGQLDLTLFNQSIQQSGQSLSTLITNLSQGGQIGQQAFANLATAISQTSIPLQRANGLVRSLATSLANTVKWQLSSSMVHGFMKSISGAISYVKGLNSSLNDIRIVTGASADEMARFAVQANKAAKELSTTTKAYADASLIYYQQGESAEMAAKKAAITIKAANASFGSSAKEMSEYLTAVWNSYQVGADELEHYVDIMAALGANTATSMEEIATSMQKVAATSNTVGVSMEQVSSIIATVSSVTRESAESIGTSFKTIFARIGDLKLGETLEDGVNLGQVSSTLDKIGVSLLDANGQMRDMGTVIEDLMTKWQTMSRAEQTAVAQVVAGKRQYTQLMALMENDDMYKRNMQIAEGSEGSLDQMADIYAQSWEAASNRVRAALETIYTSLIDDNFMIQALNSIAALTNGVGSFIKTLGGAKGAITTIGAVLLNAFSGKIATSIASMTSNISMMFMSKEAQYKKVFSTVQKDLAATSDDTNSLAIRGTSQLITLKEALLQKEHLLTTAQQQSMQSALNGYAAQIAELEALEAEYNDTIATIQKYIAMLANVGSAATDAALASTAGAKKKSELFSKEQYQYNPNQAGDLTRVLASNWIKAAQISKQAEDAYGKASPAFLNQMDTQKQKIDALTSSINQAQQASKGTLFEHTFDKLNAADLLKNADALEQFRQNLFKFLTVSQNEATGLETMFEDMLKKLDLPENIKQKIRDLINELKELGPSAGESGANMTDAATKADTAYQKLLNTIKKLPTTMTGIMQGMSTFASGMLSTVNAGKSWANMLKTVNDLSSSAADKLGSVASTATMTIMGLSMMAKAVKQLGVAMGIAEKQSGWIGLIGAAISATLMGISAISQHEANKIEALKKDIDRKMSEWADETEKNTESLDSEQNLLSNFNTLYGQYLETGDLTEQLRQSTLELASAYNIEGAAISALTGNFDELLKRIRELSGDHSNLTTFFDVDEALADLDLYTKKVSTGQYSAYQDDNISTLQVLTMEQLKNRTPAQDQELINWTTTANNSFMGTTTVHLSDETAEYIKTHALDYLPQVVVDAVGEGYRGLTIPSTTSSAVTGSGILFSGQGSYIGTGDIKNHQDVSLNQNIVDIAKEAGIGDLFTDGGLLLLSENDTWEYKMSVYDDLVSLLSYMEQIGVGGNSKEYQAIQSIVDTMKPQVEEWEKKVKNVETALLNSTSRAFVGYTTETMNGITFLEQYNSLYETIYTSLEALYPDLKGTEELRKMASELVNNAVALNTNLSDYGLAMQAALEFYNYDVEAANEALNGLIGIGANLEDIDLNVLRAYKAEDNVLIQQILESNKAQRKYQDSRTTYLDGINAEKAFSEDMSLEEVTALRDAYTWGENGIMAWADFYALSYEEQETYLRNLSNGYLETMRESAATALAEGRETVKAWEKAVSDAEVELTKAERGDTSTKIYGKTMNARDFQTYKELHKIDSPELQNMSWEQMIDLAISSGKWKSETKDSGEIILKQVVADNQMPIYNKGTETISMTGSELEKLVGIRDIHLQNIDTALGILSANRNSETGYYELTDQVLANITDPIMLQMASELVEARGDAEQEQEIIDRYRNQDLYYTDEETGETYAFSPKNIDSYIEAGLALAAANDELDTLETDYDAIMYLIEGSTESAATQVERLANAIKQLPSNIEDLQKVAEALFGGDMQALISSTAEQRAQALLNIQNTPQLQQLETKSGMTKDEFSQTMAEASIATINAEWDAMAFDLDYASYIEDLNNYNTAWSAAVEQMNSIPLDNLENYSSALDSLTSGYEEFVKTGELTEEMKDSLLMAGIDPNTIESIDDYEQKMQSVEHIMKKSAATLLDNLKTYKGLEDVDWTFAKPDTTWLEFLNKQDASVRALLEQSPKLQAMYEQWRQAAIEADGAMADFDASAIKASIAIEQSINAAKNRLTELTEEANKAKAAVDALNGALGQTGPLSISAQTTLAQQSMDGSNWGQDKKADLKLYGQARGKQAMADIDVLEAQKATSSLLPDFSEIIADNYSDFKDKNINLVDWIDDDLDKIFDQWGFDGDAIEQAKQIIGEYAANNKSINWSELFSELANHNADLDDQIESVWAGFADDATSAITDVLQVEQDAATKTVEIWRQAFQAISDARKGLAEGDSIAQTLMGNEEDMQALIKLALDAGQSWEEIQKYILDPNYMGKNGKTSVDDWVKNLTPEVTNQDYAKSQGGTSQFLYDENGQMAQDRDQQYKNAKALITDSYQTFYDGMDEVAKAAFDEAKASAEAQEMEFDPVAWLLEHYFPDYDSATGTSLNTEESQKAYNTDAAGVYTFETNKNTSEAQAEYDTAKQKYDTVYEEESQNVADWQAISDAIRMVQNGEANTTAEALGEDAAGIMERQNIGSLEELNGLTLSDVNQNIGSAVVTIGTAQTDFETTMKGGILSDGTEVEGLKGKGIDATIDEGLEETAIQTAEIEAAPTMELFKDRDQLAEDAGMSVSDLQTYTDTLTEALGIQDQFNTSTEEGINEMLEFGSKVARSADGFKELQSVTEDTWKTLKDGSKKGTDAWNKSMDDLRKTTAKLFNSDLKDITADFVEDHLDELEKMANGTEEEAMAAQDAIENDLVASLEVADELEAYPTVDVETGEASNALLDLQNQLDQWDAEEVGFTITANEAPVLGALNSIMATAALAGNDISSSIQGALNAVGWEPNITYQTVTVQDYDESTGTATVQDEEGNSHTVQSHQSLESGTTIQIPVIGNAHKISSPGGGSRGGKGGSGGGGGGGNASTHDHRKAPERYHENTKNYDRISEALEKVNKAKDKAFGKSYLKNLEKERELLNAQVNLLKEKEDEIQNYYDEDLTNLQNELNALMGVLGGENIALDIDPDTLNINNWEEIEAKITELYDKKANDELSDEEWEKITEQLAKYEEIRDQYEETVALLAENGLTIEDLLNQMSELALEEIIYKVEYQVELNEYDLELLEYYQEIFEDDLSKASLLMTNLTSQAGIAESNLAIIEGQIQELQTAYANGKINDADYYEGLSDLNSQMIEQLSELHDLQEQIAEHYANTLELAQEEMDAHLEHLDHIVETMENYRTIFELMGKGVDRDWINSTLTTQIETNQQSLASQRAMLDELLKRKAEFEANMNGDRQFSTELEQQQYEDLLATLMEVHGNMQDAIIESLELMKERYENTIEDLFSDFEEKMLGTGQSFADLADKYSYYQETQDRHLSAAQELFEMSKLNRQIEQSIEDSTSKANKQILKDLQAQINARAELKDMTEYDIEMMNLQYQLALKQMALEDAQNAKSVVRLTRDNDGNYAYQYTADDEKVASAYQEYEDVLQQINDLASGRVGELEQAMVDAQQQYADAAKEIALDMTLTEEQRQAKLEELAKRYEETLLYIQEEYGYATGDLKNNLATVSSWYNTAIVEDSSTAKEQVADMIKNAQTWAQEYANLLIGEDGSVLSAWNNYAEAIADMSKFMDNTMTEEGLENYRQAAQTAGEEALKIVKALSSELDGINATTEAWKKHNLEMANTIQYYQDLAAEMNTVMHLLGEHEAAETPPLGDASTETSDDGTDVHFADPSTQANNVNQGTTTNVQTGATETATTSSDDTTTSGRQIIEWNGRLDNLEVEMLTAQQLDTAIISTLLDSELTAINRHDYFKEYEETLEEWQANRIAIEEILAQLELQEAQSYLNMAEMASAQTIIKDSVVNYGSITQHITLANDFPNVEHVQDIKEAIEELILGASQYANSNMMSSPHKGGGGSGGGGGKFHVISRN